VFVYVIHVGFILNNLSPTFQAEKIYDTSIW